MSFEMSNTPDSDDSQNTAETPDQTVRSGSSVELIDTDSEGDASGSSASLEDTESTGLQETEAEGSQDSAHSRLSSLEPHSTDVCEEPSESETTELTEELAHNMKLKPIRITKINVEHLVDEKETITDKNHLHQAEKAIKKLLPKKHKAVGTSGQLQGKKSRLEGEQASTSQIPLSQESTDSKQTAPRFGELHLKPELHENLRESGLDFKLKLFMEERKCYSAFTNALTPLLTDIGREKLLLENEVSKSFVFLFYRNVEKKDSKYFKPEIFALTTGPTWRVITEHAEEDFTKLVERRTLEFPFHHVEFKRDGGPVLKETQSARPGQEIIFSVWDFMDKLIGNRSRKLRKDSSLCASSLNAFRTKKGKPVLSKIDIGEKSMKIRRSLTITQLGSVLGHFSQICSKEVTHTVDENGVATKNEEEDDKMFQMHDFVAKVVDMEVRSELDNVLHQMMEQSMKGTDSFIYLTHPAFKKWTAAEKIDLCARKNATTGTEKTSQETSKKRNKRSNIKTWNEPPRLESVMQALRENCSDEYRKEWLDDVHVKFSGTTAPLKKFIFSRFNSTSAGGSYVYHYGEWLEMKAEYLYHIEQQFIQKLKEHMLDPDVLQLLPWKNVGYKDKKTTKGKETAEYEKETAEYEKETKESDEKAEYKKETKESDEKAKSREGKKTTYKQVHSPDMKQNHSRWKHHFEKICDSESFAEVTDTMQSMKDFKIDFKTLKGKTKAEQAAHLYRFLESNLKEDEYNAAHTLLNMIQKDAGNPIVTCDRKIPHGIELCDVLLVQNDTTYLVHVKAGFDGNAVRDVCSQIRNAADHIFREQTKPSGTGIIGKYWKELTKPSKNTEMHTEEVRNTLELLGEDEFTEYFHPKQNIVFVLACRDTREKADFSEDVPKGRDLYIEVKDAMEEKFQKEDAQNIIKKLKTEGYLTPQGSLTDKFILDGKDCQVGFVEKIRKWEEIKGKRRAETVTKILVSNLSRSKSTIAKMEIIRLVSDFERYCVGQKKFELKICSIRRDFPEP